MRFPWRFGDWPLRAKMAALLVAASLLPLCISTFIEDPVLLKSLAETLELDGHRITAASGGQDGIDAFRTAQQTSAPFEAVITDLGMPYVDGHKLAVAVKTTSRRKRRSCCSPVGANG